MSKTHNFEVGDIIEYQTGYSFDPICYEVEKTTDKTITVTQWKYNWRSESFRTMLAYCKFTGQDVVYFPMLKSEYPDDFTKSEAKKILMKHRFDRSGFKKHPTEVFYKINEVRARKQCENFNDMLEILQGTSSIKVDENGAKIIDDIDKSVVFMK